MIIKDFLKKNIISLLAIGVSTTSVVLTVSVAGPIGSSGTTGPIGSIGSIGPSGPQGPVGPSGPSGETGPTGSSGETGSTGIPGQTPYIGPNGNWWIGEIDTGVKAEGEKGSPGEDGLTPYIGPNGNWWTGNVDSGITSSTGGFTEENIPYYPLTMTQEEFALSTQVNIFLESNLTQAQYINQKVTEGFTPIHNASQLFSISNANGKYILTQDIDISTLVSWSPLQFQNGEAFSGYLDGAGFEIQNLTDANLSISNSLRGYGLFEIIEGASIANLTFKNVDINLYDLQLEIYNLPNYLGSLAGVIAESSLENIHLDQVSLIGEEYIGGIAGNAYESTLHISNANLVHVSGSRFAGGAFGSLESSFVTNIDYLDVEVSFNGLNNEFFYHSYFGGLVGASYLTTYINVSIDVNMDNIDGDSPRDMYRIGGLFGENYYDRVFNVTTAGSITLTPNQEMFSLEEIGGVAGEAFNTTYSNVVNEIDITLIMGDLYTEMRFVSVGGLIGVATFVLLEYGINRGNVQVVLPTNGINSCIYFNVDNCFDQNDFYYPEFPIEYFGGLIGYLEGSTYITYSVNFGNIEGIVEVGGLIGSSGGGGSPFFIQYDVIVQKSFNQGSVKGIAFVGGVMGLTDERTNLIVANAYNTGDIEALSAVGGILGLASPAIGIKLLIVNVYNAGDIIINSQGGGGGGLIGATYPLFFLNFNFFGPEFNFWETLSGTIEIHSSFNVGEMFFNRLDEGSFNLGYAIGSIIGFRFIQTRMYGVSYLQQLVQIILTDYDELTDTYIPNGKYKTLTLPGVAAGNNVDLQQISLSQSFLYFDQTRFIYRSAWNFTNVWEWRPVFDPANPLGLPTLKMY